MAESAEKTIDQDRIEQIVGYIRKDRKGLQNGSDISLVEIMALAELMVGSMQTFFKELDTNIYREFRELADYIGTAKNEIGRLQADDLSDNHIPSAGEELDAIVQATETATNTIMEAAEKIMEADPSDSDAYQGVVNDSVMEIFEACSFQDITGQRISRVVQTLQHIDDRVSRFAESLGANEIVEQTPDETSEAELRRQSLLLNGPQDEGIAVNQDDIDALLNAEDTDTLTSEIDERIAKTAASKKSDGDKSKPKAEKRPEPAPVMADDSADDAQSQNDIDALFD